MRSGFESQHSYQLWNLGQVIWPLRLTSLTCKMQTIPFRIGVEIERFQISWNWKALNKWDILWFFRETFPCQHLYLWSWGKPQGYVILGWDSVSLVAWAKTTHRSIILLAVLSLELGDCNFYMGMLLSGFLCWEKIPFVGVSFIEICLYSFAFYSKNVFFHGRVFLFFFKWCWWC